MVFAWFAAVSIGLHIGTARALNPYNGTDLELYCRDESRIISLQAEMIHSARLDIFSNAENNIVLDMELQKRKTFLETFYSFDFDGLVRAVVGKKKNKFIHYFRIFKNGNEEIKELLKLISYDQSTTSTMQINAFPNFYRTAPDGRKGKPCFVFTFFRDPIRRFLSAYTEIMLRKTRFNLERQRGYRPMPMSHFIENILHWKFDFMREMNHVWSQMGPLVVASRYSAYLDFRIRLYRLEDFKDSLADLANVTGIPQVYDIYADRGFKRLTSHDSSADPLGTKRTAKEFLEKAPSYMLALCRIYYSDFICAPSPGYKFPEACMVLWSEAGLRSLERF